MPVEPSSAAPRVAVVIPVKNEEGNIAHLVDEIERALSLVMPFEIVVVNDGSTDGTKSVLQDLANDKPWLSVVTHAASCGQSVALRTGILRARAPIIATLDGDGQNDPAFLPAMIDALQGRVGLVQGERQGRQATGFKKIQSRVANAVRRFFLKDSTRDSGCGLKVFPRALYLTLPFFDALHRFMPALVQREGWMIVSHPVQDRARASGVSNYGFFDRLWVGLLDLFGVWWLIRRRRHIPFVVEEGHGS